MPNFKVEKLHLTNLMEAFNYLNDNKLGLMSLTDSSRQTLIDARNSIGNAINNIQIINAKHNAN